MVVYKTAMASGERLGEIEERVEELAGEEEQAGLPVAWEALANPKTIGAVVGKIETELAEFAEKNGKNSCVVDASETGGDSAALLK